MHNQFVDVSVPNINDTYYCVKYVESSGFTYLMKLVLCANKFIESIDLIKKIIADCPEEINKKNSKGWTALMLASTNTSRYSNNTVVKLLIDANADVNLTNNEQKSALSLACEFSDNYSNIETVRLLIDAGANVECQDNFNNTPLGLTRNNSVVKLLIDAKANLNHQNKSGMTLLMKVCQNYYEPNKTLELITLLVESGANINLSDNDGRTALLYACTNTTKDCYDRIRLFVELGADVNATCRLGSTPLSTICGRMTGENYSGCKNKIIKLLLDYQAQVCTQEANGSTPLSSYLYWTNGKAIDDSVLKSLIIKSKHLASVCPINDCTNYQLYLSKNLAILDDNYLGLLRGDVASS